MTDTFHPSSRSPMSWGSSSARAVMSTVQTCATDLIAAVCPS